jgi:acetylornithine deacetylase/succinyl-diaminopimelate desuccinylase-like protein
MNLFARRLLDALSIALLLAAGPVSAADNVNIASEARLANAAKLLASDEFEGRGVGTEGINKAADFIAAEFKRLGLKTDLFDDGPFQKFSMTIKSELGPKEKNHLVLVGPPEAGQTDATRLELQLGKSFTPLAVGGSGQVEGQLVFVGYGITDKEHGYDEYAGVDVKDKIVVMIRREPQQGDAKSVFNGTQHSQHAMFMRKFANAAEHSATAVIVVNDDFELQNKQTSDRKAWREELDKIAEARSKLTAEGIDAETTGKMYAEIDRLAESISTRGKRLAAGYDELLGFAGAGEESGHKKMPVWFALRSSLEPVIKQVTGKDLATIEREIDAELKPLSQELPGWNVQAEASINQVQAEVKNVVAVLEGEGSLADETIIVGAHYDHVGFGGPGSLAPWTTEVHNGADDNASGTAALIETAERLVASGVKPKRRIVFIAFTAEERGLIGSAYYCRNPRFPLEKTIAMLNMDMVGRLRDDKLIVFGTGTAAEFDSLVSESGAKHSFQVTKKEEGFGPSDHSSFYAQRIPVLHLFTDNHADYHRPTDDADKLNVPGMRRVVDFLVDVIGQIDSTEIRPTYREIKKVASIGDGGDRPYFGSIPDYASEGIEGLKLMGVSPKGPAEAAGLQGGDVIIGLGESKITGIETFDSALRKFKPGDKAKVKLRRGDKVIEVEVTFSKRPQ